MEPQYFHEFVGGNFRLDEIQAAILLAKLPYLADWSAARRRVAERYGTEFRSAGLTDIITLAAEPFRDSGTSDHHIYHKYVIRARRRDALHEHLRRCEIGSAIYYPLGLHEQKCFQHLGYKHGDLPQTEAAAAQSLALPIYPELTPEAQHSVVAAISEFYTR